MLSFTNPLGGAKTAMMAHNGTQGNKNKAKNGNQKANGTVENRIRVRKNGATSPTTMNISHGTVVVLFLILSLVVTVFNQAGGTGGTVESNGTKVTEIKGFHLWKDATEVEVFGTAQTMTQHMEEIFYANGIENDPFFVIQDPKTVIKNNFGELSGCDENGHGYCSIDNQGEWKWLLSGPHLSCYIEGSSPCLDSARQGCLSRSLRDPGYETEGQAQTNSVTMRTHGALFTDDVGLKMCFTQIEDVWIEHQRLMEANMWTHRAGNAVVAQNTQHSDARAPKNPLVGHRSLSRLLGFGLGLHVAARGHVGTCSYKCRNRSTYEQPGLPSLKKRPGIDRTRPEHLGFCWYYCPAGRVREALRSFLQLRKARTSTPKSRFLSRHSH